MKKRDVCNIFVLISIICYLFVFKTIILTKMLKYAYELTSLFFVTLTCISYFLYGYRETKDNLKRKRVAIIIKYLMVIYLFTIYGLGLLFGFLNNVFSISVFKIIGNVLSPLVIIVSSEILRNLVIQANKDKKIVCILISLMCMATELMLMITYFNFTNVEGIFKFVATGIIPLSIKHLVLGYTTYHTGYKNSLLYRLVVELYIYFVPIVPDLGDYISCMIEIIFPVIVFLIISSNITQHEYVEAEIKKGGFSISSAIFTVFFVGLVCLVGGVFNHKLVAIASESMSPSIRRGDAVLIEKVKPNTVYKKNDIISFDDNGRNTVHRIVEITEVDGVTYYTTKGDNNNSVDTLLVPIGNVRGKVLFKLKYLGYPSVLISELRSGISERQQIG